MQTLPCGDLDAVTGDHVACGIDRRIVADCRAKGLPLPQIEISVGEKKDNT